MRVLFTAVEMSPLAKVGGLADVAGSLPKALVGLGHDVRVILPLHAAIDTAAYGFHRVLADVPVPTPRGPELAAVWEGEVGGVTTYLVEAADMFERPAIYGEPDDAQRFLFFSDAVLATVPQLGGTGGGALDRKGLGNRTGSPIGKRGLGGAAPVRRGPSVGSDRREGGPRRRSTERLVPQFERGLGA